MMRTGRFPDAAIWYAPTEHERSTLIFALRLLIEEYDGTYRGTLRESAPELVTDARAILAVLTG